ncbi:hypothetical protein [Chamaesiphon sp.]|uniref:hypothetical protein n=1 Tax=Chamaesiphon sp. TaxID=2814140 RepID=UPI003593D9FC
MAIERISEWDWFHKYLIVSDFPEYIFLHPTKENCIAMCCDERKSERLTAAPPLAWNLLLNIPQTNIYIDTDKQILRDRLSLCYFIDEDRAEVTNVNSSSTCRKTKDIRWVLDDVTLWYYKELIKNNSRVQKIYSIVQRDETSWTKYFIDRPIEADTLLKTLVQTVNPNSCLELVEIDLL